MNDELYIKSVKCLACTSVFKTTKVKDSKVRLLKRDTDFFRYYEGANPYFYEINVCPSCGFAFSDNLKHELNEKQLEKFISAVSHNWRNQDYGDQRDLNQAIETYKLAYLSGQVIGLKASVMAGICLRICWLYRLMENPEEEKRFINGAVGYFTNAYDSEDMTGNEGMTPEMLVYLLGELNFRLGNGSEAAKWFNIALSKYGRDPSVKKQTIDMVRDRWLEIKDQVVNK